MPTTTSTEPAASPASVAACSLAATARERSRTVAGKAANRWSKVRTCWSARTVVGTRTATWRPSWIALKAARSAISVFPYPTSPTTIRSIGRAVSMSAFTSSIARSWSRVSSYGKEASSSCCHGVSGANGWPSAAARAAYRRRRSSASTATARRTRAVVRAHSPPPRRDSDGRSAPA